MYDAEYANAANGVTNFADISTNEATYNYINNIMPILAQTFA